VLVRGDVVLHVGIKAGLKIDDFAPRLSFFWGIGMNFYMASVCTLAAVFTEALWSLAHQTKLSGWVM